jgi:hypothetical protein
MTHILNPRERKLLDYLQVDCKAFQIPGQLPIGTGTVTLSRLTKLGLIETGPGRHNVTGYRLTDDGWRSMYGKPKSDLGEEGAPHHTLKVWSWPPTEDADQKPSPANRKLKALPPRLKELPPRLSPLSKRR